jgi:hypothetical protein
MKIVDKIKRIPHALKFQYWKRMEEITHRIAPFQYDAIRYYRVTGKKLNWNNPTSVSQKLMWLNRFDQNPLKVICADKYRMRQYVTDCGLSEINVPLIGVWDIVDDIDWSKLPNQFVLKTNHGCGTNIICKDKSQLDIEEAKRKLKEWLRIDFGKICNEQHYSKIQRCILAEEYLPMGECPLDYKIHCFNGEPYCFLFYPKHDDEGCIRITYSLDWERKYYIKGEEKYNIDIPKPINLVKMLEYARILAKPFPYVRVDFYEVNGKLYIGELTFTSFGNMIEYFYTHEVAVDMGNKLILPKKYHHD